MADGDLGKRADVSAPGELGLFARAFNRMAGKLHESYRTLEERIEQRTSELNASNEELQQEVVEREMIEQSLQQSSDRITTLMNSVVEGIYGVDKQGNCTFINIAGVRLLGYQEEGELLGRHMHDLIHHTRPDGSHYPSAECRLYRCLQTRENVHVDDEWFWRKDGSSFPVDYWSRPTMLDGEWGAVVTFFDITERKVINDKMRVAAATFETHEGILITDAQANIVRVNRAFEEITGYSAGEVLGRNPRMLSSGRQSKEFYAEMWRALLEEGGWSGEILDRRKNGEIYPKWLTISAVKNEQGKVTEYVAIFSDITARKRAEEEIRSLAFFDALTGLPNRRFLLDRFHLALSQSARSHHCGALLFLDMDKFKILNDTQGHDYGDLMLIEVGRRIRECVRETDTVARLGGDEFVVLFEEIGANMQEASKKIALIAEKVRAVLSEPYALKGYEFRSSPSIGVSMYRGNAESVDILMKQADMAMYQAKDAGRNAVRFFDPLMQQAVEARAELETDLRGALHNHELQLHYQIQMDSDSRPIGAEALIRWMHPRRGMVPPLQFIPVAEESALILDIGHWVFEDACRQLAEWQQDEQMCHLVLAVNVSAHQFRLRDFVERLEAVIARYDIVPAHLKLELTESVVLGDVADVVVKMHALKALGVRLSLDDFGTGYSSLAYLKQLPLDQIKIDQSFVRDVITDPNDAVMVKAIIDMAQNFRLNVIAEGVETEAQLAFLKQNGCMAYQGYLFSKPVPVGEFEALARRLFE
ncbi:MAG: EAL domain-containing protein [Nitrosomonadales bacterium]|nr:EAL domain-containing protein [Nitrosomonadales bacterium]